MRLRPRAAYLVSVGITAVNPATVVCFAAVVLGNHELVAGAADGVVFVAAAFAASASWQLLLAGGGAGRPQAVVPRSRPASCRAS